MAPAGEPPSRRAAWTAEPEEPAGASGWLALGDDDLLFRIQALPPDHAEDEALMRVVRSSRHFFVRQEAAKRVRQHERLKGHSEDRHIGQILVRAMTRREDAAYLENLVRESRHVEVKKAAEAQLALLAADGAR
ncbi:MAG TPA: hypothetical protein VMR21_06765 [Vicinamibacteria bacterium]|nr:hypothetical protein [Vicinamibacteria bacterium]